MALTGNKVSLNDTNSSSTTPQSTKQQNDQEGEQKQVNDLETENDWLKLQIENLLIGRKALAKANRKYRRELRVEQGNSSNNLSGDAVGVGQINIPGEGDEFGKLNSKFSVAASVGTDDLNVTEEITKSVNYLTSPSLSAKVFVEPNQPRPNSNITSPPLSPTHPVPLQPSKVDQATSPCGDIFSSVADLSEAKAEENIVESIDHATTSLDQPLPSVSSSDSGWLLRVKESIGFGGFRKQPSRGFATSTTATSYTNTTDDDSTLPTIDFDEEQHIHLETVETDQYSSSYENEDDEEPGVIKLEDSWCQLIRQHCRNADGGDSFGEGGGEGKLHQLNHREKIEEDNTTIKTVKPFVVVSQDSLSSSSLFTHQHRHHSNHCQNQIAAHGCPQQKLTSAISIGNNNSSDDADDEDDNEDENEDEDESETETEKTVIYNPRNQQIFFQLPPEDDEDESAAAAIDNNENPQSFGKNQDVSILSTQNPNNDSSYLRLDFDEEILSATKLTKSEANGIFKEIECSNDKASGLKRQEQCRKKNEPESTGSSVQPAPRDFAEVWSRTSPWIMLASMATLGGFLAVQKLVSYK